MIAFKSWPLFHTCSVQSNPLLHNFSPYCDPTQGGLPLCKACHIAMTPNSVFPWLRGTGWCISFLRFVMVPPMLPRCRAHPGMPINVTATWSDQAPSCGLLTLTQSDGVLCNGAQQRYDSPQLAYTNGRMHVWIVKETTAMMDD